MLLADGWAGSARLPHPLHASSWGHMCHQRCPSPALGFRHADLRRTHSRECEAAVFRCPLKRARRPATAYPPGAEALERAYHSNSPAWDVVGLGQAMVDISASVDDSFLHGLHVDGLRKGERRIISAEERARLLQALDGSSYQVSAGGSLSNTLVAMARLGAASSERRCCDGDIAAPLAAAMASISGRDPQGAFHSAQLRGAGVRLLGEPGRSASTGTVIVLVTPDANRTFLSYLGTKQELALTGELEVALASTRMVLLEGYLWEMPGAAAAVKRAIMAAHAAGAVVAMTAGDAGLVARHRAELWGALRGGVDIFFANRAEASALLGRNAPAAEAAAALASHCSLVAVTDGANGSALSALGRVQIVPPFWAERPPLDTCGAGDAYAAGLLHAWLSGAGLGAMGAAAARAASAVIAHPGAALGPEDAATCAAALAERIRGSMGMPSRLASPDRAAWR